MNKTKLSRYNIDRQKWKVIANTGSRTSNSNSKGGASAHIACLYTFKLIAYTFCEDSSMSAWLTKLAQNTAYPILDISEASESQHTLASFQNPARRKQDNKSIGYITVYIKGFHSVWAFWTLTSSYLTLLLLFRGTYCASKPIQKIEGPSRLAVMLKVK